MRRSRARRRPRRRKARQRASRSPGAPRDVVMPGMNGRELSNQARALAPGIKILFMSGYSEDAITQHGRLDPDVELIEKPFSSQQLAARVRIMLAADIGGSVPLTVA